MPIKSISIKGLRGYGIEQVIHPAIPDGINEGSGLTIIIGPNNSGKSTIIEAIDMVIRNNTVLKEDIRNKMYDDTVEIKIEMENEKENVTHILKSEENGGAIGKKYFLVDGELKDSLPYDNNNPPIPVLIVPKDRNFNTYFSSNVNGRYDYLNNNTSEGYRSQNQQNSNNLGGRLANIAVSDRERFDNELSKIISPLPEWRIEANSKGEKYLKFIFGKTSHSSNGAGDGFINIFTITAALYDAPENHIIVIDEPESSLHPDQQRKLMESLVEHSRNKQVIICTHSPYFIDWEAIKNGANLIRTVKDYDNNIKANPLSEETRKNICKIVNKNNDIEKPHNLGIEANEVFFLNDNVILVEGQEDVGCYKKLFQNYNFKIIASFLGWGARRSR